jgi:CRISPR-associated endonuclease Cas3-HD
VRIFGGFIARPGQLLADHLLGVAAKAGVFCEKIGLSNHGELLGLLHDFGKYSQAFQNYIQFIALNSGLFLPISLPISSKHCFNCV